MVVLDLTFFAISYKSRTLSFGKSIPRAKINHVEFCYVALNNYTNVSASFPKRFSLVNNDDIATSKMSKKINCQRQRRDICAS